MLSQVQELYIILAEIHGEWMVLSETFQVASIIEKLPPGWKDFKNYLKHKRKEMSIKDLVLKLRIEEDNRVSDKRGIAHEAKANVVEHGHKNKNLKNKWSKMGPKGGVSKKSKFQERCFNCDKMGHKFFECRLSKKKKKQ